LYFQRAKRFRDVKPYCAFVVDGVRWIKIPFINGVNATKSGGGQSTTCFSEDQLVGEVQWEKL
jgi:hypothetical protein